MNLPPNFQFSQTNLQDFIDCRRRFHLKHILHLAWPAIEAEPVLENERLIELGLQFHQLIHQYTVGFPIIESIIPKHADELTLWWENFLSAIAAGGGLNDVWSPSTQRFSEIALSGTLGNARLVAKMDLIAIHAQNKFLIVDWKTARHVPKRSWLAERVQTKIYPYLLHQAGAYLNNGEQLKPAQIEMLFWYPSKPEEPIRFPYNLKKLKEDDYYLQSLSNTLLRLNENEFFMTDNVNRCKFCAYRSLCDRGVSAGYVDDPEELMFEDEDINIDFSQIDEIAF